MRRSRSLVKSAIPALALTLAFAATVTTAAGQKGDQREPSTHRGSWYLGGDLGFQNTTGDDDLDAEPIIGAYAERFQTEHFSLRGMLQFVDLDHSAPRPSPGAGDAEILILGGNALYNWHGRQVSPYVTGGLALYDYDTESGHGDGTEPGMNAGGGLNLHVTPVLSIKFEALVHVTAQDEGPDSFVAGTGGLRFGF